jgi:hypothetical protein
MRRDNWKKRNMSTSRLEKHLKSLKNLPKLLILIVFHALYRKVHERRKLKERINAWGI